MNWQPQNNRLSKRPKINYKKQIRWGLIGEASGIKKVGKKIETTTRQEREISRNMTKQLTAILNKSAPRLT